jgi:hypothetical protein
MTLSDISGGKVDVSAYTIPTDAPEGDGTLRWDSTTLIAWKIHAANLKGWLARGHPAESPHEPSGRWERTFRMPHGKRTPARCNSDAALYSLTLH